MSRTILQNTLLFLAGMATMAALLFFWWQTSRDSFAKKALEQIATNNQCLTPTQPDKQAALSNTENKVDQEVYFVGCGGFF